MRTQSIACATLLVLACLGGCRSTSPARLCQSPLVRVNVLEADTNAGAIGTGSAHE